MTGQFETIKNVGNTVFTDFATGYINTIFDSVLSGDSLDYIVWGIVALLFVILVGGFIFGHKD